MILGSQPLARDQQTKTFNTVTRTSQWILSLMESQTWNLQAITALVDPHDVNIIASIALSKHQMEDRNGWHFTKNGKYSVKSGYQVERVYPDKENPPDFIGSTVDLLKAFCWEVRCPPKIRHFLWQLFSGCIAVKKNLKARGIQEDICCARCGDPEESINHVFFNVFQHVKCGHYLKYHRIPIFFLQGLFLVIWIIFFGELIQR